MTTQQDKWERLVDEDQLNIGELYFIAWIAGNRYEVNLMEWDGNELCSESANIPCLEDGTFGCEGLLFVPDPLEWPKFPKIDSERIDKK